ncbi:MAG: cardiolipin synthase [Bacteroidetes bacterium]|nr:MAG: cardiolipin synthase [Bacteroidota bacterium]
MENDVLDNVDLFDDPAVFSQVMLDDIGSAKSYIFLEIYKFGHDSNGTRFRDLLVKKCSEGVQVKLLLDSWGTPPNPSFFDEISRHGGEVRYFKKIRFFIDFFTKNHRRNHRKLLIIDDKITYIGSANITAYSMKWRELMLRLDGPITPLFRKSFLDSYKLYRKYIFNKFSFKKTIHYKGFEIIQDLPSIYRQQVKKRYEKLIKNARHEIVIESPYFIPGYKIRRNMMLAAKRYMGFYYNYNINIHYYQPANLHAKCLLVDNEIFAIGSANFDYRSFRYLHEIVLVGNHKKTVELLRKHLDVTLDHCVGFNYQSWKRRPLFEKIFGWFLIPFRHLF